MADKEADRTTESIELAASLRTKVNDLELRVQQLSSKLQQQVESSQQHTLDHLLLYETAVSELQETAESATTSYAQLLRSCRQLSYELRGVDLLAGRVAALRQCAEQLEGAVDALLADKAKG